MQLCFVTDGRCHIEILISREERTQHTISLVYIFKTNIQRKSTGKNIAFSYGMGRHLHSRKYSCYIDNDHTHTNERNFFYFFRLKYTQLSSLPIQLSAVNRPKLLYFFWCISLQFLKTYTTLLKSSVYPHTYTILPGIVRVQF